MFCRSLFVLFLLAIVLSVLRFTDSAEGVLTVQAKEIQKKILGNLIEIKCIVLKDIC
jgi:hypothetical protein